MDMECIYEQMGEEPSNKSIQQLYKKEEERNMSVDRRERPEINPYTHRIFDLRKAASQNT